MLEETPTNPKNRNFGFFGLVGGSPLASISRTNGGDDKPFLVFALLT